MQNFIRSLKEKPLLFLSKYENVKICHSITEISKYEWNELVGNNNPFLEYEFFKAMEVSKSTGYQSGWITYFITVYSGKKLTGAIPLFLKYNSHGEFIFDWSWASAYNKSGVKYYPKFVIAVPFTPATGKRILIHPDYSYEDISNTLIQVLMELAKSLGVSSIHWLFTTKEEMGLLAKNGFMPRYTFQFHWKNNGYQNFDDFLSEFNSKNRNQIKRERKQANSGTEIELLTANQLKPFHWELMYKLYLTTIQKKWSYDYLTKEFFEYASENLSQNAIMLLAKKEGKYIAGTLNFRKNENIYGRYWGAFEEHQCLHFELCYYRLIDFAISEKIKLFEAGAQGEHKFHRGFLPEYTYSAHWILDPVFSPAIADYLRSEKILTQNSIQNYLAVTPFKKI